jgi:hypothetical protein
MSFSSPSAYVQLPFTTDPNDLADAAIAALQAKWPGWTAEDGDPGVIFIEGIAPMAANAAQIAAQMPPAALIAWGTKVLGIPYETGVAATATATFTVQDANGPYDIPAGSEVDIGGVAFQSIADLVIPNGSTTGAVVVAANEVGIFANGFNGVDWSRVSLPVYVTNMTLGSDTSGGVDQQDDNAYLSMVAQEMQLRSRSIITLPDFEIVAVNTAGIARAVAVAQGAHPRNIDVFVTDPEGNAVSSTIKTALATAYSATRMVNAVVSVNDPAYTTVSVTYELLSLPSVDPAGLLASANARIGLELSPAGWGAPTSANPGLTWVDQPVVHVNRLIGVISSVAGADYVKTLTISADNVAQLSTALTTGAGTTTVDVDALVNALPAGTYTITDPTGAHTDTFTTTAPGALAATSLTCSSKTFNFAYPIGSTIGGAVTGDLTMNSNAAGALPKPGTFTGTIDTPSL